MANKKKQQEAAKTGILKGWQEISAFLGQPVSVAERWADTGMPVERKGRHVYATAEELQRWLGRESAGEPVQIAGADLDLNAALKRGLAYVRNSGKNKKTKR
jgi:hypothetical protein